MESRAKKRGVNIILRCVLSHQEKMLSITKEEERREAKTKIARSHARTRQDKDHKEKTRDGQQKGER
jgi:hypothetical protein